MRGGFVLKQAIALVTRDNDAMAAVVAAQAYRRAGISVFTDLGTGNFKRRLKRAREHGAQVLIVEPSGECVEVAW